MIEVGEYRINLQPKTDGTLRATAFKGSYGTGPDWMILNHNGIITSRQGSRDIAPDLVAALSEAVRIYLGTAAPEATYSLNEVMTGAPAPKLSSLNDKNLIDKVYELTGTPIVGDMGRYIIREIRYRASYGKEVTRDDLNIIVQDAWEDNAHRE